MGYYVQKEKIEKREKKVMTKLKRLFKGASKHFNSVGKVFDNSTERNKWVKDMSKGIKKYHPKLIVTTSKKDEKHSTPLAKWISYTGRVYFRKKKKSKRRKK